MIFYYCAGFLECVIGTGVLCPKGGAAVIWRAIEECRFTEKNAIQRQCSFLQLGHEFKFSLLISKMDRGEHALKGAFYRPVKKKNIKGTYAFLMGFWWVFWLACKCEIWVCGSKTLQTRCVFGTLCSVFHSFQWGGLVFFVRCHMMSLVFSRFTGMMPADTDVIPVAEFSASGSQ